MIIQTSDMEDSLADIQLKKHSVCRHFKGRYYLVDGVYKCPDEGPTIVGYRPLYRTDPHRAVESYWRTLDKFLEVVQGQEGCPTRRFNPVESIEDLNRAYKSDLGGVCKIAYLNHPVGRQIVSRAETDLKAIVADLRAGLRSHFRAEDACEPFIYLAAITDLAAWHGGERRLLLPADALLLHVVREHLLDEGEWSESSPDRRPMGRRRRRYAPSERAAPATRLQRITEPVVVPQLTLTQFARSV